MQVIRELSDLRAWRKAVCGAVALVPTMGYLHQGHEALLKHAKSSGNRVVMSLFVNPTQFNQPEDFASYPRDIERDMAIADACGVDAVWLPSTELMYRDHQAWHVTHEQFDADREGFYRPGHFQGVATVVMKLLNQVGPDCLVMGEKDFQQCDWIRQMVNDFFMPVRVDQVPTVREASGLAMSSRNVRLSASGREKAALIYEVMTQVKCIDEAKNLLHQHGFKVEYFEEVDARRFVAAWLEGVRLIDTVALEA